MTCGSEYEYKFKNNNNNKGILGISHPSVRI
jgi:hypothetical protein